MSEGVKGPATREKVGVVVIHGVGETSPGWINDYLVPELQQRAPDVLFEAHSEVHSLPDEGRAKPGGKFNVFSRNATYGEKTSLALIEFFWNDLSKIGTGPLTGTYAMLKLFYEAPQVLGEGFLIQCRHGVYGLLRLLIMLANWLLRWPISGINTAAFVVALVWIGLRQLKNDPMIGANVVPIVLTVLLVLAVLSVMFARWRVHRDIALTDIGLSTAISSFGLAVLVVLASIFYPDEANGSLAPYLMVAGQLIFGVFLVWNHIIVFGIVLLAVLAIWRLLLAEPGGIPLSRPAAALGLATLQGVAWKIAISSLWVLVIAAAEPGSLPPERGGKAPVGIESVSEACTSKDNYPKACLVLTQLNSDLTAITVVNSGLAIAVALALVLIALVRRIIRRTYYRAVMQQRVQLPRMIVSPVVFAILFTGTALAVIGYYQSLYFGSDSGKPGSIPAMLGYYSELIRMIQESGLLQALLGTTTALSVYAWVAGALRNASRGVLHIARDIVDHQYTPRFAMSRILLPKAAQRQRGRHPRRERIEKRLDALMNRVVQEKGYDRLVFVAHSQGTVILHDYLRTRNTSAGFPSVKRIDVVTLASPLTHLYQHYFYEYERRTASPKELNALLHSWTNIWRIDDPIGHRVDILEGDFIDNQPIKKGGHLNYWKEDRVCKLMLHLIHPDLAPRPSSTASESAKVAVVADASSVPQIQGAGA